MGPLSLIDGVVMLVGIVAISLVYAAVARDEIARENTATDDLWRRGLAYYRPDNQKGAGDESPDALEGCAQRDVRAPRNDTAFHG